MWRVVIGKGLYFLTHCATWWPFNALNCVSFSYRLTFYTAKGKTFGPWGDRRSKESVDFDVSAPPGHALAYFSGTVDFGVPFRSISFHWRPIPT